MATCSIRRKKKGKKELHMDLNEFSFVSAYQQPTDLMDEVLTSEINSKRDLLFNWENPDLINAYMQTAKENEKIIDSKKLKWKMHDHCRAICEDDGEYYEALILEKPIKGKTMVWFLGFKKEQEVSVKNLQRSLGKIGRDLELKAIAENKVQPSKTWSKNDVCRAKYEGDGNYYEAEIVKLLPDEMCTVLFIGYNETQDVLRANLKKKPSKQQWSEHDYCRARYEDGKYYEAKILKIKPDGWCTILYLGDNEEHDVMLEDLKRSKKDPINIKAVPESTQKYSKMWSKHDYCRALYEEDGKYYEAKILKIKPDGWCTILYLGYNEEQDVMLEDLKRSKKDPINIKAVPKSTQKYSEVYPSMPPVFPHSEIASQEIFMQ